MTRSMAICMLAVFLGLLPGATKAAIEPLPSFDDPRAIDEEIADVRELAQFVSGLVEAGRVVVAERFDALVGEENDVARQTTDITALHEARALLDGVETRISTVLARRQQVSDRLRLIEDARSVARDAATVAPSLREVVQDVGASKLDQLHAELEGLEAVYDATLDALHDSRELAADRLALIQSRLRLDSDDATGLLQDDAHARLAGRLIDRLLDQGLRLQQEASRLDQANPDQRARSIELSYRGEAAIIRSNLRLRDLGLFAIEARRASVAELAGDPDIPLRVLEEARSELAALRSRIDRVSAEAVAEARRLESLTGTLSVRLETAGEPVDTLMTARNRILAGCGTSRHGTRIW